MTSRNIGSLINLYEKIIVEGWGELMIILLLNNNIIIIIRYAALIGGWLCLCRTDYDRHGNVTDAFCNIPCRGHESVMYGGNMYKSVYRLPTTDNYDVSIEDPGEMNKLKLLSHFSGNMNLVILSN